MLVVNIGEFFDTVKKVSGNIRATRKKPFPIIIEPSEFNFIKLSDAEYGQRNIEVLSNGKLCDTIEINAILLLKIAKTYPAEENITIHVNKSDIVIEYKISKMTIPCMNFGQQRREPKNLPKPKHVKPPEYETSLYPEKPQRNLHGYNFYKDR